MLDLVNSLHQRLSLAGDLRGEIRIGVGELAAATWFPRLAERLSRELPLFALVPTVAQGQSMLDWIAKGVLDCAVTAIAPTNPDLSYVDVCSTEFAWMAAPSIGVEIEALTPADLHRSRVIRPSIHSGHARNFDDWASDGMPHVGATISCNSLNAMVELTAAGIGVSLLPRVFLQPLVNNGLLVKLNSEPKSKPLQYYFVWNRWDRRPTLEKAKELVLEAADHDMVSKLCTATAA